MAVISRRRDIDDKLDGPTAAEEKLLAACAAGEPCVLGDGAVPPEDAGPDRVIRAEVLRYLILGGCEGCPVEGRGVELTGALVIGPLNLSFQTARGSTYLVQCRFPQEIEALETRFQFFHLSASSLVGLNAQGAEVKGNLILRGAQTNGGISLMGAVIGGQVDCKDASLDGNGTMALNAQGAAIKGGIFLRGTETNGEVSLSGAVIGGQVDCQSASLDGNGAMALSAESVEVKGGVFLRGTKTIGEVSLLGALIAGQVVCDGTFLDCNKTLALNA